MKTVLKLVACGISTLSTGLAIKELTGAKRDEEASMVGPAFLAA